MDEKRRQPEGRRWNLSFWPVLAFACVLPGLLWLGLWQVQRGDLKAEAYRDFERAAASEARDANGLTLAAFNELPRYEQVRLHGRFLAERQFLLDNMSHEGRPGHHVLVPFLVDDADYAVIVDLGWRPGRTKGAPAVTGLDDVGVVAGMLAALPRPALKLGDGQAFEGWPRSVQFPDAQQLASMLDMPVAAPRLLLDETAGYGLVRDWQPPGIPPARHYAYAVQWFGLAAALVVIFIVVARRGRERKPEE